MKTSITLPENVKTALSAMVEMVPKLTKKAYNPEKTADPTDVIDVTHENSGYATPVVERSLSIATALEI